MAHTGCIDVSCEKIGKALISTSKVGAMTISAYAVCVVDEGVAFYAADSRFVTFDNKTIILR